MANIEFNFSVNDTMRIIGKQEIFDRESKEGKALDDICEALGVPASGIFWQIACYSILYGRYIGRLESNK